MEKKQKQAKEEEKQTIVAGVPLLVVEGVGDKALAKWLYCEKAEINRQKIFKDNSKFQVYKLGGINQVDYSEKISLLVKTENFYDVPTVGFLIDADGGYDENLTTLTLSLKKNNILLPTDLTTFTELKNNCPPLGIFILPNNSSEGMLETVLLDAISPKLKECILDFHKTAFEITSKPDAFNEHKGRFRAYLSTTAIASCGVDRIIEDIKKMEKPLIETNHRCFDEIRNFLDKLQAYASTSTADINEKSVS